LIEYAQLIVLVTIIVNPSDYFKGIYSVRATDKSIPQIINKDIDRYSIMGQSLKLTQIHDNNVILVENILSRVSKNQIYRYISPETGFYTEELTTLISNCCRFLALDTSLFF